MRLNPEEIVRVLESKIADYKEEIKLEDVGKVIEVGDGIARVYGLNNVMANEMVEFVETELKALLSTLKKTMLVSSYLANIHRSRKVTR